MNKTNFKLMNELLSQISDGWTVECPYSVAEKYAHKVRELLKKIDYCKECSGCSKHFLPEKLVSRQCCDKVFCHDVLFSCASSHDLTCEKHKKNLEKFREEKEQQFIKGTQVETRISKKQAAEKGLIQCCCHRYFVPEVKRKNSEGKEVYYKSCLTCRNKRKV